MTDDERRAAELVIDGIVEWLDVAPSTGEDADADAWEEWRAWANVDG